jgi:AraC family transcriptional activator of mtrCDE
MPKGTEGSVKNCTAVQCSDPELDALLTMLKVDVIMLAECVVSTGWSLSFPPTELPAIHYSIMGSGHMIVGNTSPMALTPHTLIIAPPRQPIRIEAPTFPKTMTMVHAVEPHWDRNDGSESARKFVAGDSHPEIVSICGYFQATYGTSINIFEALPSPIIEHFDVTDQLEGRLKSAVAELAAQQIGMGAMTATLLKQVLVTLLRRSLTSSHLWRERFLMLSDPQIARAFAEMVARPGASHSITTLSQKAGLSRSVFMARFTSVFGCSPMAALRQLRMRCAANLLAARIHSVEQIANTVGYSSRSSFFRAFREAYGKDPSEYRASVRREVNHNLRRINR